MHFFAKTLWTKSYRAKSDWRLNETRHIRIYISFHLSVYIFTLCKTYIIHDLFKDISSMTAYKSDSLQSFLWFELSKQTCAHQCVCNVQGNGFFGCGVKDCEPSCIDSAISNCAHIFGLYLKDVKKRRKSTYFIMPLECKGMPEYPNKQVKHFIITMKYCILITHQITENR